MGEANFYYFTCLKFPFSFQNWKGTFHLVLLKRESYIFNDGFFDEAFGDRRKRASVGAIGGHHRQGAPSGTKSRRRQMRRYQHLRKFLPQQVKIHGLPSQALLGQPQERAIPSQSPEPYPQAPSSPQILRFGSSRPRG